MNATRGGPVSAGMGQTCNTIVFACTPPVYKDSLGDRVYDAARSFSGMCGNRFRSADLIGFELATGGSGHDGALDLNGMTVALDALEEHEELGPMLQEAREQWPAFVAHIAAATGGKVNLKDVPRVYLTETETG